MNEHAESGGKTSLHQAASQGFTADIEKLISSGTVPDVQTRRGRTALHYAAENGHKGVVELLLRSGAQVNLPNKWGRTALHYAASKHRVDCIGTLINNGADPNRQDVDCQTPLYHAVAASKIWIHEVKLCDTEDEVLDSVVCDTKKRGTIVNDTQVGDNVELYTRMNDTEISVNEVRDSVLCDDVVRDTILLLISRGANADISDKSGFTPLHLAAEHGNREICINLLEEGKTQINAFDQHGATPLHFAIYQGHRHVAELLLSRGACSDGYLEKQSSVTFVEQVISSHAQELLPFRNGDIHDMTSSNAMFKSCETRNDETSDLMQVRDTGPMLNERNEVPLSKKKVDFSSCLLEINETEGLGRVKRTAEVERIEQDIGRYIEATLQSMVQVERRLSYVLLKAGSTAENTKVGEPDEIDFMCCLTDLSKVSYPYTSTNDPSGYLRILIHRRGLKTWSDFVDKDGFLIAEKLHRHFHAIFDRHSENSDLLAMSSCLHKMRDYRSRSDLGVTVDMSQTKPGSRLYFLWRGCQFKRLVVTVDLIPAIEIPGWPHSVIVPARQGCYRYHVIPKVSPSLQNNPSAGLFWRISTSMTEQSLFSAMDTPTLACYTICKLLVHCSNPHRLFPPSVYSASQNLQQLLFILHRLRSFNERINSYLLKMIFLRERAKRRQRCDWVWSTVGDRVSAILKKLIEEMKQSYVPSFFLRDYNVLTTETLHDYSSSI